MLWIGVQKRDNMNIKKLVNDKIPNHKKVIQYQNVNDFSRPSIKFVGINPTHKILVIGRKKRKKGSHKVDTNRNYESIALVLKDYLLTYTITFYITAMVIALEKLSLY